MHTFSGTHDYNPEHAAMSAQLDWATDGTFSQGQLQRLGQHHAERVTEALAAGKCPRCLGPIELKYPAGSRLTQCRCIPICSASGEDEVYQPQLGLPVAPIWKWPTSKSARTRRRNQFTAKYGEPKPATMVGDQVLSSEGVTKIVNPKNTGGWAQYGHDDEAAPGRG